jgi:hypothetical protein
LKLREGIANVRPSLATTVFLSVCKFETQDSCSVHSFIYVREWLRKTNSSKPANRPSARVPMGSQDFQFQQSLTDPKAPAATPNGNVPSVQKRHRQARLRDGEFETTTSSGESSPGMTSKHSEFTPAGGIYVIGALVRKLVLDHPCSSLPPRGEDGLSAREMYICRWCELVGLWFWRPRSHRYRTIKYFTVRIQHQPNNRPRQDPSVVYIHPEQQLR